MLSEISLFIKETADFYTVVSGCAERGHNFFSSLAEKITDLCCVIRKNHRSEEDELRLTFDRRACRMRVSKRRDSCLHGGNCMRDDGDLQ